MTQLESHSGYYLWKYLPSTAAAVIFLLLFITTTAAHTRRMIKTKTWVCSLRDWRLLFAPRPSIEMTADNLPVEVIGYIGRCIAHNSTGKLLPFILQNFFILLAPALFAASIYMVLGRIIRSVRGERHSLIRVHWLTRAFVTGDVLSL
jgi:hypothetical protein